MRSRIILIRFIKAAVTLEWGSDFIVELAAARDSEALSMTARDLGISDFIFMS